MFIQFSNYGHMLLQYCTVHTVEDQSRMGKISGLKGRDVCVCVVHVSMSCACLI